MAISTSQEDDVVSDINVTPLVDVMLVLLIVFIVTTPLLTNSVKVNLPKAAPTQAPPQNKAIVLSVNAAGEVFLDEQRIQLNDFENALTALKQKQADLGLNLNADEGVSYGIVAQLLASIERVGVDKLSIITTPR